MLNLKLAKKSVFVRIANKLVNPNNANDNDWHSIFDLITNGLILIVISF